MMWTHSSRGRTADRMAVDPLFLRPADVRLADIIQALSHQVRYLGHVGTYTIAQHSVLVADAVRQATTDDVAIQWALLHDAGEAYVGDWPAPLKHADTPAAAGFRAAERRIMAAIAVAFELPVEVPAVVKAADLAVLAAEGRDLFHATREELDGVWGLAGVEPVPWKVRTWSPNLARTMFHEALLSAGVGYHD